MLHTDQIRVLRFPHIFCAKYQLPPWNSELVLATMHMTCDDVVHKILTGPSFQRDFEEEEKVQSWRNSAQIHVAIHLELTAEDKGCLMTAPKFYLCMPAVYMWGVEDLLVSKHSSMDLLLTKTKTVGACLAHVGQAANAEA